MNTQLTLAGLGLLALISSCTSSSQLVEIQRIKPAEFDLAQDYKHIAIEPLKQDKKNTVTNLVREKIYNTKRVKLVDRENLYASIREKNLSQKKKSKIKDAGIIISGTVTDNTVRHNVSYKEASCYENGTQYKGLSYLYTYQAHSSATFEFINPKTTEIINMKKLSGSANESSEVRCGQGEVPDEKTILRKAQENLAQNFADYTSPHQAKEFILLYHHESLPELALGNQIVEESGNWKEAEKYFIKAFEKAKTLPEIDPETWGYIYNALAYARAYQGDLSKAYEYLDKYLETGATQARYDRTKIEFKKMDEERILAQKQLQKAM